MGKKSTVAKVSWWIFAVIGVLAQLPFLNFENKWVFILIGVLIWSFGGWLLGLIIDYIVNSLFYQGSFQELAKPDDRQKTLAHTKRPIKKNESVRVSSNDKVTNKKKFSSSMFSCLIRFSLEKLLFYQTHFG